MGQQTEAKICPSLPPLKGTGLSKASSLDNDRKCITNLEVGRHPSQYFILQSDCNIMFRSKVAVIENTILEKNVLFKGILKVSFAGNVLKIIQTTCYATAFGKQTFYSIMM